MANKTLYVRESDLPLWDLAQAKLGQNMSALFAEFLREKVQTMNAYVHVLRSFPNSLDLVVMFAPVGPRVGRGSPHYVREQQLVAFLETNGVAQYVATKIAAALKNAQSVQELTVLGSLCTAHDFAV